MLGEVREIVGGRGVTGTTIVEKGDETGTIERNFLSTELPALAMSEIRGLDFASDDHAPPRDDTGYAELIARCDFERIGYQTGGDCSGLPEDSNSFTQKVSDDVWGLGEGHATELDLEFPGITSVQGDNHGFQNSDNSFESFYNGSQLDYPLWIDPLMDMNIEPDFGNIDFDVMKTLSTYPITSDLNLSRSAFSSSDGTSSDSVSASVTYLNQIQANAPLVSIASTLYRFQCDTNGCTRSYTRPYELQRHQLSHSGVKKYCCRFYGCGRAGHQRGFARKDHLRQHLRQVHKVSD